MGRKKKHEEHANHERWLVSYADFITLLFAFFTSMYAISSVNEGKFRVLSESLSVAFNPSLFTSSKVMDGPRFVKEQRSHEVQAASSMSSNNYQKIQSALKKLETDKRLALVVDEQRITIRLTESSLFEGGTDRLLPEATEVLDEIAVVLKDLPNSLRVEGHTDNIPVRTAQYPSNWDLSSARAIRILKYFFEVHGFDPSKLSAAGYGEFRPVETNDTPSGRAKNRRVDIMVMQGEVVPFIQ